MRGVREDHACSSVLCVCVCARLRCQVFEGKLPTDLPLVWNPRLTATAGQVVDDGSRNKEKSSREQRIPVRLELSSKVCLRMCASLVGLLTPGCQRVCLSLCVVTG
jgi:hypothetical protein